MAMQAADATKEAPAPRRTFLHENPSVLWFMACLGLFTLIVSVLSEGMGTGVISTSLVKILGMTLCLCLIAIAMDLVWGYCGILSLGHFAFFGLGGYAIGMWLMYARTEIVVRDNLPPAPSRPPRPRCPRRSRRRSSASSARPNCR
jgi:urea transport system permease protein